MKCLLVVDVQNGFVSNKTEMVLPRIEQLMKDFQGSLIIATQFINAESSGFRDIMHWGRLKESPEIEVIPFVESLSSAVIRKTTYTACTEEVLSLLRENNIDEVYITGIDTDCCVLASAIGLFEQNIRPVVLEYYCASNGGKKSHEAALTVLERTIGKQQIIHGQITLGNVQAFLQYTNQFSQPLTYLRRNLTQL